MYCLLISDPEPTLLLLILTFYEARTLVEIESCSSVVCSCSCCAVVLIVYSVV